MSSQQVCQNADVLCDPCDQTKRFCMTSKDQLYSYLFNRAPTSNTTIPDFVLGEGARADLESDMRPCWERTPAGDPHGVRNAALPLSLTMDPVFWNEQWPDDLGRLTKFVRIEEAMCDEGPPCVVRAHY